MASAAWRGRIDDEDHGPMSRIFADGELERSLEAAFLLKPTGIQVASWTRDPVSREVISVMAATLWGSLDTMVRALGGSGPRSAMLEIDDRRILAVRVSSNWTLFLVAPGTVGPRQLEQHAQRIAARLSHVRKEGAPRRHLAEVVR